MNERTIADPRLDGRRRAGFVSKMARRLLFGNLRNIRSGSVTLIEGSVRHAFGDPQAEPDLSVVLQVESPNFYSSVVYGGSIGAAESYMRGEWSCDGLVDLVRILVLNREVLDTMDSRWAWALLPFHRLFHFLHKNTVGGSAKNIEAHYDLSNEFFSLFLDETMTYSCAVFESPDQDLRDASIAKIDRICRKLDLRPTDRVVEIGAGWGAFAIHAAENYGCHVTTTTISKAQYELATQRVRERGLEGRIEILLEDYRKLEGRFDKLVSIEMIEAVGHQYYDAFFKKCSDLLHDDGRMLLQCITIADSLFESHVRSVDFIKRYVFPGSCLPSVAAIMKSVSTETDMTLSHVEDLTVHYVRTLAEWRRRFFDKLSDVRKLGYSEEFIRMWEYYLCYCEGAFAERTILDMHLVFAKAGCRCQPILPGRRSLVSEETA